jgi:hypothetical protein
MSGGPRSCRVLLMGCELLHTPHSDCLGAVAAAVHYSAAA